MSIHLKLIIPLLGFDFKKEDFDPKNGFMQAYTCDINRPYLDNHIFLLYSSVVTNESIERDTRFKKIPSFYNRLDVWINGMLFICYTFVITNKVIKDIKSNSNNIPENGLLRVYKFWSFTDDEINHFMFDSIYLIEHQFEPNCVPEWDYKEDYILTYDEKAQALVQRVWAFVFFRQMVVTQLQNQINIPNY